MAGGATAGGDQRQLLLPREPLQRSLAPKRGAAATDRLLVDERDREAGAGVARPLPRCVAGEAPGHVVGRARVERAVAAAQEVDAPATARLAAAPSLRRHPASCGEVTGIRGERGTLPIRRGSPP